MKPCRYTSKTVEDLLLNFISHPTSLKSTHLAEDQSYQLQGLVPVIGSKTTADREKTWSSISVAEYRCQMPLVVVVVVGTELRTVVVDIGLHSGLLLSPARLMSYLLTECLYGVSASHEVVDFHRGSRLSNLTRVKAGNVFAFVKIVIDSVVLLEGQVRIESGLMQAPLHEAATFCRYTLRCNSIPTSSS